MRLVALGAVVLVLGALDLAAIHDIVAGEPDVRLEWALLAISALVFTGLLSSALGKAASRGGRRPLPR